MSRTVDLNADLGEHGGDGFAADAAILDLISSANIACGAHAGSPEVMRQTVRAAAERGVSVGAHPGYADREGFGRRELSFSLPAIGESFIEQLAAMRDRCVREGTRLRYVKPHGALYNRAARDGELASLLAELVSRFDSSLWILSLPDSELERAARAAGLSVAREAFIDRAMTSDGMLVPRSEAGAMILDADVAASRAVTIAAGRTVESIDGKVLRVDADSFCVHGDSENALAMVRLARTRLEQAGFSIAPFAR